MKRKIDANISSMTMDDQGKGKIIVSHNTDTPLSTIVQMMEHYGLILGTKSMFKINKEPVGITIVDFVNAESAEAALSDFAAIKSVSAGTSSDVSGAQARKKQKTHQEARDIVIFSEQGRKIIVDVQGGKKEKDIFHTYRTFGEIEYIYIANNNPKPRPDNKTNYEPTNRAYICYYKDEDAKAAFKYSLLPARWAALQQLKGYIGDTTKVHSTCRKEVSVLNYKYHLAICSLEQEYKRQPEN